MVGATKMTHDQGMRPGENLWQPRFHDHIIRSDVEHFYVQRYVEMNPLLWYLDSNNRVSHDTSLEDLSRVLKEQHSLNESAVKYLIERETEYRSWQQAEAQKQYE